MKTLECLQTFFDTPVDERDWWPLPADSLADDESSLYMAAAVSLTGELDSCRDAADLRRAIDKFGMLVCANVFTAEQLRDEAESIRAELVAYGKECDYWASKVRMPA